MTYIQQQLKSFEEKYQNFDFAENTTINHK